MKPALHLVPDDPAPTKRWRWPWSWRPSPRQLVGAVLALGGLAAFVALLVSMTTIQRGWLLVGVVWCVVLLALGAVRNWIARATTPPGTQIVIVRRSWW